MYYVYAYIRNKDSATAKAGTPYYIGKGTGRRAYQKHGKMPVPKDKSNIIFIKKDIEEYEAISLEIFYIRWFGRKNLNTGILHNKTDGGEGASGWIPATTTREKWKSQRTGIKQTVVHINLRADQNKDQKRTNEQRYNCLLSSLNRNHTLIERYKKILDLFDQGYFIEKIYNITLVDKEVISKIIKYNKLYKSAIDNKPFDEKFYDCNLKWSCNKISHILSDKEFYQNVIEYVDKNYSVNEIVSRANSNHTRIRFIIKNITDIREIINLYD